MLKKAGIYPSTIGWRAELTYLGTQYIAYSNKTKIEIDNEQGNVFISYRYVHTPCHIMPIRLIHQILSKSSLSQSQIFTFHPTPYPVRSYASTSFKTPFTTLLGV